MRALIAICAASAGVHAALAPTHFHEAAAAGVAFAAAAGALATVAVALDRRPESRRATQAAALLLGALITSYVATRIVAVPELSAHRESIDTVGVATKLIEAPGLALAIRFINERTARRTQVVAGRGITPMKLMSFTNRRLGVLPLAGLVALVSAALALALSGGHTAEGHEHGSKHVVHGHGHANKHTDLGPKELALHDGMRKLWEDHITWTRLAIVSFAADLPDFEKTAGRLLENQEDIGDAVEPFYGRQAANRLTSLLKEHIVGAVDLLKAAKAGDDGKFAHAKDAWYANGDEIARFLNGANPRNWPLERMQSLMRGHLDQTLEEAAARLKGDFAADIRAYDEIHHHILVMADTLSAGIVKQFPHEFR